MGLFDFGSKEAIKVSAYKISTGIRQIEQELEKNNHQITPMVRGLASAINNEVRTLEKFLKPNGRTDWNLYNSTNVKTFSGEQIDFCTFEARVNNMSQALEQMAGNDKSISFRIWT